MLEGKKPGRLEQGALAVVAFNSMVCGAVMGEVINFLADNESSLVEFEVSRSEDGTILFEIEIDEDVIEVEFTPEQAARLAATLAMLAAEQSNE